MNYRIWAAHPQARLTDRLLAVPIAPRPAVCAACQDAGQVVTPACVLVSCPSCRPAEAR